MFRQMSRFSMRLFLILALASCAPAHDIPNDVLLRVFVKPEGQRLNLLVRAPLPAIRDISIPERAGGYLDLERIEPLLPDASLQWIADFVQVYENDAPLTKKPRVVGARISLASDQSFAAYEQAAAH